MSAYKPLHNWFIRIRTFHWYARHTHTHTHTPADRHVAAKPATRVAAGLVRAMHATRPNPSDANRNNNNNNNSSPVFLPAALCWQA